MAYENFRELTGSREFFYEIVEPDFKDFCANSLNMRYAIHSVFSMAHMAEWYYYDNSDNPERVFNSKNSKDFLISFKNCCIYYRLISDVANAYKHVEITTKKYKPLSVNKHPVKECNLPYPKALLESEWAMGEPSTVLIVKYHCKDKVQEFILECGLGKIINLWKLLIDNPNSSIKKHVDEL